MRLILYTGKGGVGKSSIAAATAVRTAELGRRTLLVSSDLAHNLSDIFDRSIGAESIEIANNLYSLEIDPLKEIRENWAPAQDYFAGMLAYLGIEDAVAEEVALFPGLDELFLLTRIQRELESEQYDVIVVDCSPTAGTLRQLTLSDTASTKLKKLTDAKRKVFQLARPFLKRVKGVRHFMPEDEIFDVFDHLINHIGRLGEILKDPEVSSARLILNPDRVAIAETRRAFTYFGLFGFPVDAIVVNKVLPAELAEGYFKRWVTLQHELLQSIEQSFLDVPKFHVPLMAGEPIGLERLSELAQAIFGHRPPDAALSSPKSVSLDRVDGIDRLTFWLPIAEREDLDVHRKETELFVTAGSYTRVFSLPDSLAGRDVAGARFLDGALTVSFR